MIPPELKYFLEAAKTLNLSRAAERIGISQPSLSAAIKRLEHDVGIILFTRHKTGVSLTQAGKQLLAHSQQLIQYWEDIRAQAQASHTKIQGTFTIGCPGAIALLLASRFIPELCRKHEKLTIHFKHDISRRLVEEVINLSIDISIVVNPVYHPDLIIRKLYTDKTTFWIPNNKQSTTALPTAKSVLFCNPELQQTQLLLKQAKKRGITFSRIMHTTHFEIIRSLLIDELAVGILPETIARAIPSQLQAISSMPSVSDEVCVIYRPENHNVRAVQTIIAAIKDSI